MSKYIDADKLIVEIKRLDKENKELLKSGGSIGKEFLFGIGAGYADIIKIIDSLQQEQPEVDLEKAAQHVYESWMGGKMDDVRRDMVELGKVLNARKEE